MAASIAIGCTNDAKDVGVLVWHSDMLVEGNDVFYNVDQVRWNVNVDDLVVFSHCGNIPCHCADCYRVSVSCNNFGVYYKETC